ICGLSSRGNASEATGKFSPRARFSTEATSSTGKRSRFPGCGRNFQARLNLGEIQPVPGRDPTTPSFTWGQLDRNLRSPSSSNPPGPHVCGDFHHLAVSPKEHDIDGKAHEEHVNRPRRAQQQPFPILELTSPQKHPSPSPSGVGNEAPLADDSAIHSP